MGYMYVACVKKKVENIPEWVHEVAEKNGKVMQYCESYIETKDDSFLISVLGLLKELSMLRYLEYETAIEQYLNKKKICPTTHQNFKEEAET